MKYFRQLRYWPALVILITTLLLPEATFAVEGPEFKPVSLDQSEEAINRGRAVFSAMCQSCHSLKSLGLQATARADKLKAALGVVPPDLSVITKARGKDDRGAQYVYALLTAYTQTKEKNKVFPNIAMPDPGVDAQMAQDVAVFLHHVADPHEKERRLLGYIVLSYMAVLTIVLYVAKGRVWSSIKH